VTGRVSALDLESSRMDPGSPDRDVAGHAKVGGVENLVSARVGEDGLGVDTGLVGEGAEAGDVVVATRA
jgi:hypothetical protein